MVAWAGNAELFTTQKRNVKIKSSNRCSCSAKSCNNLLRGEEKVKKITGKLVLLLAALTLSLSACGGSTDGAADSADPLEDTDAILTITKADGTNETLTVDELQEIDSENELNYENNYMGCEATVEGKVCDIDIVERKIMGNVTADTAEFRLGASGVKFWIVPESDSYEDVGFDSLKEGSVVRVTGTIGNNHVFLDLDDAHDFEIVSA